MKTPTRRQFNQALLSVPALAAARAQSPLLLMGVTGGSGGGGGGTTYGMDFRGTSGYVTDPSNHAYSLGESYPSGRTLNGQGFGWSTGSPDGAQDALNTNDARLAGKAYTAPSNRPIFRLNLPSAGSYKIYIAMGDQAGSYLQTVEFYDDTTLLDSTTINAVSSSAANSFVAADGIAYTHANFVTTGFTKYLTFTFATSILKVKVGSAANYSQLVYLAYQ